jgi:hypothetical protein
VRAPWIAAGLLVLSSCAPSARSDPSATPPSAPAATPASVPTAPPAVTPETTPVAPLPSPSPIALPLCTGADGLAVFALCPRGARVDIDVQVGERDAAAIAAQIVDDLAAVQQELEWTLRGTPRIDVYATNERYAIGLRTVFGYSRATADYLAESSVAFFEPSLGRIAVSWEAIRERRPIAAIRHELMHFVTLEACAPRCDLVPAWLNEGQAHLFEALMPGADWRLMRVRYEAASMVGTNTVLPLTSLWTQLQWNAIGDWAGYYKYQEAARATELLRQDIGDRAIARLYARLRAGDDVARAYAALSGRSFASYLTTLGDRLIAGIPAGPGIALVSPGADGSGVSYLLYAFPTEAKVTLRIRARHLDETQDVAVSPQGALFGSIDDTYPPGAYTMTASSGSTEVTTSVTKRGGRTSLISVGDGQ